jgi:hypothetical protein|nr:MAG TPA: hypothetical protein [Caudoviricetes sp.]
MTMIDRDELLKHEVMIITKGNAAFHGVPSSLIETAPVIDIKNLQPVWRDPETDPPKVETEVLVLVDCGKGYCITTAFYEDGTVSQYESLWQWEDVDDYGIYDEEDDLYRLPKGWWEYRHFTPEDALECPIAKPVVGWMPLPEKLKSSASSWQWKG